MKSIKVSDDVYNELKTLGNGSIKDGINVLFHGKSSIPSEKTANNFDMLKYNKLVDIIDELDTYLNSKGYEGHSNIQTLKTKEQDVNTI